MTLREGRPVGGRFKRGYRDWPLESGGCRPENSRRSGTHHRPRSKEGALPGRVLLMRNTTTPMGSGEPLVIRSADREEGSTPQRAQDDPRSEGRQPKGSRKPGRRAGTSAGGSRITGRIRAGALPERALTWVR